MAMPTSITIPTEPIGSIPRSVDLIERVVKGDSEDHSLAPFYEDAIRGTIERFEATGSPVVSDGEQVAPAASMGRRMDPRVCHGDVRE